MRTTVLITILTIALMSLNPALSAERTPIAFVGSFESIARIECEFRESTNATTGEGEIVICLDSLYRATYRVEKVLEGKLVVGSVVTFSVADHYGFPEFAEQKQALIFLEEEAGNYHHIKYQWAPAYKTSDGEFAQCGCELEEEHDAGESSVSNCQMLSFAPPVIKDLTHASQYVLDKLHAGLDYKIQGTRAQCVRGILVRDMYKRLRPELMDVLNAR